MLLPSIEFQATTQGHYSLSRRIELLSGLTSKKEQLRWLLQLFSQSHLPESVKDELYGQLKVFVQSNTDDYIMDRRTLNFPATQPWKGRKIIRPIRTGSLVRKKLDPPVKLSFEERASLMDTIKCSLALHYRETDPVTFADADELEFFDMGRGLHIAIVGLQKQRRLSL